MTEQLVPPVEPARVSAQKPFHARHQIPLRRLHHQMKMIPHQTQRMNLPARSGANLPERFDEPLAIPVIFEYLLTPIPAIHHMINRARIFHSQPARHAPDNPNATQSSQY